MQKIPNDIMAQFEAVLMKKVSPVSRHADYRKWLRYYFDFRSKYPLPDSKSEHVRLFIEKLRSKNQTPELQKQAAHAISLYFEMLNANTKTAKEEYSNNVSVPETTAQPAQHCHDRDDIRQVSVSRLSNGSRFNEWRCLAKSKSPAWDKVIDTLAAEIKTRHYSRKTLKTYADWSRKFQSYLQNKPPDELSSTDIKAYLTYLAVNCKVSASTQNQRNE